MSDRLEIRMSSELLERLDAARGDVPRGTFVKRALESALAGLSREDASAGPTRTGADRDGSLPSSRPVSSRASEPVAKVLGSSVRKVPKGPPSIRDTWGR